MSVRGLLVFAHVESTSRLRRRRGVTDYVIRVYVCTVEYFFLPFQMKYYPSLELINGCQSRENSNE